MLQRDRILNNVRQNCNMETRFTGALLRLTAQWDRRNHAVVRIWELTSGPTKSEKPKLQLAHELALQTPPDSHTPFLLADILLENASTVDSMFVHSTGTHLQSQCLTNYKAERRYCAIFRLLWSNNRIWFGSSWLRL
jgi:hypothetical protein